MAPLQVAEVNLFRERRSGLSKACGFVVMGSRAAAVAAMAALDDTLVMPGAPGPLSVKWADPELQLKKRRALEDEVGGDRKVTGGPRGAVTGQLAKRNWLQQQQQPAA